jgi:hypothetical protein
VDHDLARTQLLATGVVQPEPITPQVDLDNRELLRDELREIGLTPLFPEALERGARQDLPLQALGSRAASARTDRQVDAPYIGDRPQALLDDRLAQEAGAAGDQDGLALQGLGDQDRVSLVVWFETPCVRQGV